MGQHTTQPATPDRPRLVLCADDFGFSPGISAVIADLAHQGRLNAISCMAVCPGWTTDAALLKDLPASVEIGLHLVLTDEKPLSAMTRLAPDGKMFSCDQLTRLSVLKRLNQPALRAELHAEIIAQFNRFEDAMGRPPAFVDGHQHAHLLAGIRDLVLTETAWRAPGAWVRNCADSLAGILARPFPGKAAASALESRGLARAAADHGLACNDSFGGHYDFASDYSQLFPRFLRRPGKMHLVMCHPGAGDLAGDSIASGRKREAQALGTMPIAAIAAACGFAPAGTFG